jgi:hypothetical protein
MIYVQAGLYAEGKTDYDFLIPLLERLLDDLLAQHYPGQSTALPSPLPLGAEEEPGARREARIAEVIQRSHETCQLFVIHADADGDALRARNERIEPGVRRGLEGLANVAAAACIPIQMIEAWMLVDDGVLRRLGGDASELPPDPERVREPKQILEQILDAKRRGRRPNIYQFVGENVALPALRRLPGFRAFEDELVVALRALVPAGM